MIGYGIDFGTTNSVVAVVSGDDRPPIALVDKAGLPHPSVVWYRAGQSPTIGAEAKGNINRFAEAAGHAFVTSVKRHLGQDKRFHILGKPRTAREVAADVLRYLKEHAKSSGWPLKEAVMTIPVHFKGAARRDLREAAREAGIEVLAFIHEPFAAAVAYYRQHGYDFKSLPDQRLLVFDWGGGTLDITLTQTRAGRLEEVATGGLDGIAGDRFDERIQDWARSRFLGRYKLHPEAFALKPDTRDRFREACEQAKIALSTRCSASVQVASILQIEEREYDLDETLTRDEFEALIESDVRAAMHQVDWVLKQAAVSYREIDAVLLIGGTSCIPLVSRKMRERFGSLIVEVPNARTIIAEGAAIVAYHRFRPALSGSINLLLADGSDYTIFDGDTLVPIEGRKQVTLFCTDNRTGEARLIIRQVIDGSNQSAQLPCKILSVPVSEKLPLPYNHERVYANFTIDEDFVLHIEGYGATQQQVVCAEVHDLKFGLRVQ